MKNIVIFESISTLQVPVVFWYLLKGYKIIYLKINSKIENSKWFQNKIKQNRIKKVDWDVYSNFKIQMTSNRLALEQIEKIYNEKLADSKIIKLVNNILNTSYAPLIYKKVLAEKIRYNINLKLRLDDLVGKNSYKNIVFYPIDYLKLSYKINNKLNSSVKISFSSYLNFYFKNSFEKIKKTAIIAALPIWIALHIKKKTHNKKVPENYQLGIRIYRTDLGFYSKLRSIDFLLDDKKLNKNNTLFCIEGEISNDYLNNLKKRDYKKVQLSNIFSEVDKSFMKQTLNFSYLFSCFKTAVLSTQHPLFVAEISLRSLHGNLQWKQFQSLYQLTNFVAYNDMSVNHIIRNIVLGQKKTKTYHYLHSCHFANSFFTPADNLVQIGEVEWSYIYYDYFVSWNENLTQYFSIHPSEIKQFVNLGALWSEHVRLFSEKKLKSTISDFLKHKMNKPSSKIISVFDTTFGKDAVLKINDMEKFLEGILNILNESSELSVVFKKKFNWNEMIENHQGEEIISIYEKLKSHNRCYFLEDNSESAEAIAASDLVISACFTSCTVEALGAGKKAMFFDGAGNLRNYHYDKFPKMVAHGYDELKDFVNFWLYEINEEDFRKYLNEQVKSDLDPFVDGKAITRFRKLLSE